MKKYDEMPIKNLMIRRNTVRKLANISWAISAFGPWIAPVPEIKPYMSIGLVAYFGLTMYKNLAIDKGIAENKDYLEFQKIYSEVLDEMVNLSNNLDNKTVMEHYTLYRGLLEDNMLSCGKSDNRYQDTYFEPFVAPEFTLNGHGVCRHQAAMGCDFYSKLGIENNFEVCNFSVDSSVLPDLDSISDSIEKIILAAKEDGREEDVVLLNGFLDEIIDIKNESSNKKKRKNNHVIMKVNEGDNTYLLDTTQRTFYTASDEANIFRDNKGKMIDTGISSKNKKYHAKLSPTIATHNIPTSSELTNEYRKSILKYEDNLDMIIKFNLENQDRLERAEEIYIRSLRK